MLCTVTWFTWILEKYSIDYGYLMKTNMFLIVTILAIAAILTTNSVTPVSALGDTVQQIHAQLDGFTVLSNCCTTSTAHVEGDLITNSDGTMILSSQSGALTIGSTSYVLKFVPTSKIDTTPQTDACTSGIHFEQLGDVELTANDGTVLKGIGGYSWGSNLGCPDGDSSFTYFSGKFQDTSGQTIEFFTGTNSLPEIQ